MPCVLFTTQVIRIIIIRTIIAELDNAYVYRLILARTYDIYNTCMSLGLLGPLASCRPVWKVTVLLTHAQH